MTSTAQAEAPVVDHSMGLRRFGRHYLEMVAAMVIGMVVLGMLESVALDAVGWSGLLDRADVDALVMATNMTVAMASWMRFRGHARAPLVEMVAAMYLPFVLLVVPLWLGAISEDTLLIAGHVLMLPAMAAAMLLRRDEYTHHGHH